MGESSCFIRTVFCMFVQLMGQQGQACLQWAYSPVQWAYSHDWLLIGVEFQQASLGLITQQQQGSKRVSGSVQVLCRPSLLFHSVGKSKSQGQTRLKRRWNKHHLMMKGTERPHFPGCEYRDSWGSGTVVQSIYHRSKMDKVIKCYLVIRGKNQTSSVFQAAAMVLPPYCVFCVYYD